MKKVLKLSSLLAAVLLLAALAGVQLLSAQVRTDVDIDLSYVSNNPGATNMFMVVVSDDAGWDGALGAEATTSVAVRNEDTKDEITLELMASTTAADTTAIDEGDTCGTCLWTAMVNVVATSTGATDPFIVASDGDVIKVTYQSADSVVSYTDSVTVDAEGPVFSNVSPGHGTRTKTGTIIFTVDISDAGVGVGDEDDVEDGTVFNLVGVDSFNGVASDQDDGNWRVSKIVSLTERDFEWYITLSDTLGNATRSDAVADDEDDPETQDEQDYTLVIDLTKPEIASAMTGTTLDTSGDEAAPKASNDRKSIAVVFDEDLNGDTVDADDFLVVVDKQNQDIAGVAWDEDIPTYVFITLETDLAGDDTPTVRVVRGIEDVAGNEQSSFEPEDSATDGIAPSLTVSIIGQADDNPVTNGELKIRVSADEDSINPNAKTGAVATLVTGTEADEDGNYGLDDSNAGASIRTITPNETWEWTFEFDDGDDGLYNVCVTITDISDGANPGMAGLCGDAVDTGSDDVLVFEVDTQVMGGTDIEDVVSFTGTGAAKTDNAGAFIEIDMSGEGDEYMGDSHGTITALSATIGGEAVGVSTLDDKVFTIGPPADGYTVGEYDVVVTATDETGNTKTFSKVTVEITERAAFTINLRPGYNLISLPGAPESSDINDVIGADHSINQVLTYSPFVEGGWLSAERGDDGAFAGTLTTIDGSTAYIVRTTSFEPLEVSIPRATLGNVLPPQTNLEVGWNLVPVVDLSSDLKSGDTIEGYFQGVGDAILTIGDSGRLTATENDDAMVGRGYWVYASRPAVLLPTQR